MGIAVVQVRSVSIQNTFFLRIILGGMAGRRLGGGGGGGEGARPRAFEAPTGCN